MCRGKERGQQSLKCRQRNQQRREMENLGDESHSSRRSCKGAVMMREGSEYEKAAVKQQKKNN